MKHTWRSGHPHLTSLPVVIILLSGCTIEARTPVESPNSVSETDEAGAEAKPDPDDDFVLPKAESVGDVSSSGKSQTNERPADEAADPATRIGRSTIWIGPRPPWAELTTPNPSPEDTPQVPTQWRLKKSIWVGHGYLHQADFLPDGKSVVTLSNQTGEVYHYSIEGKLLSKVALPGFKEFDDAAFSTMPETLDRPQLLVARPSATSVLDLSTGTFEPVPKAPPGNAVEHSGRTGLYGLSYRKISPQSGSFTLGWITGELALEATCSERPDGWTLSSDGTTLAISYYPGNEVEVIDLVERKLLKKFALPKWGSAIDFSPDGTLLAMGGEKLQVVRLSDGALVGEDTNYGNNIDTVRFTPQGDLLLTSAYDGKARSYTLPKDLTTLSALPKPQSLPHGGEANVYGVGLTKDGRNLVTSSGDKTMKIWTR